MQRRKIINPIIKDTAVFHTTALESEGKITQIELELYPGGGNDLHFHTRFSETFTAIDGDLTLRLGKGKSLQLSPGEKFTVQPGQHHAFFNAGTEKVVFMIEITPGDSDFERFIHIFYKMAADGSTNAKGLPKDFKTLAVLLEMGDIGTVGTLSLLTPYLKFMARRARKAGIDKKLIRKYCTEEYFFAGKAVPA